MQFFRMLFLGLLIILNACTISKDWPSPYFQELHNYQEVTGSTFNTDKDGAEIDLSKAKNKGMIPDVAAKYPNGIKGIHELISKKLIYPEDAIDASIEGRVLVVYMVDVDGFVKNVRVHSSAHPILDREAVRIIESMERWIPATYKGKKVKSEYLQPIRFKLT